MNRVFGSFLFAVLLMWAILLTGAEAFAIPMPVPAGTAVKENGKAEIDYSNSADGYVMVKYGAVTLKGLRVIVKGPGGSVYTYTLNGEGAYEVYPLSEGNGSYTVTVYEQVEASKYATANGVTFTVTLVDEFAPFLRPNQYVNYHGASRTVAKAAELVKDQDGLNDKIGAIYHYVIKNISYDGEMAAQVQRGYLPDVDGVLKKGKGICFDYAAVTTAMLRSQGIPSKLVVGYTGQVYHAWINVYSQETGWVDSVIYFDGRSWKLMDPTFASGGKESPEVMKYIGTGSNYSAKYLY